MDKNLSRKLSRPVQVRHDLTEALKKLQCQTLSFVGENSRFHAGAVLRTTELDWRCFALVEQVQGEGAGGSFQFTQSTATATGR